MRSAQTILILTPALFLAGCLLRGKPQPVVATPPPPAPMAKAEPAPPPQPLSVPQTTAELPPPQPVSPEAVAAAELPGGNAAPSPAPARSGGARHVTTGPPPIPAPKTEPAAPATPPAATPPAEPSKPIQEIVPVEEQKRLQEAADARKRDTRQALEQISRRRLSHQDAITKRTIESYLRLSDQAEAKGDMRQASEIAERAWVLAKELQGVR